MVSVQHFFAIFIPRWWKRKKLWFVLSSPVKSKIKTRKLFISKAYCSLADAKYVLQVVPTSKSVIGCCFQSIFMQLVVKVWRHVWRGSDNDENEEGRSLKKRSWGNGSVYYSSVRVNIVICWKIREWSYRILPWRVATCASSRPLKFENKKQCIHATRAF